MALVAWYKLNGNVLDSTVNGNHGTIVGSPTVVSDGPFGSCYNFNPENGDYITINNLSSFIYNTPFTISAWIKTAGLGTGQTLNGIVTLTYGLRLCANSTGSVYSNLKLSSGSYSLTSVGINVNDNVWHHVCCTYNGDQAKLYIDGNLNISSATGLIHTNIYTNGGAIGMDVNDSSKYKFNGSISDVRIYDEALSLKEIKELSKAKVLHYDFNQYQEPTTNLMPSPTTEKIGANEYLAYADTTAIFDSNGIGTYTFSFDVKAAVAGSFSCYCSDTTSENIKYKFTAQSFDATTEFQRFYMTTDVYLNSATATAGRICFYAGYGTGVILTVKNVQIEKKDHATPFVNGTRTAQVYDKSGYDNNAELALSTTPTYVNESIVNNGCYEFNGTKTIIIDNSFGYTNLTQEWTVSTWAYLTTIDETQYLINGLNSGIAITWGATRKSLLYLNSGSNDYYIYGLADKIPVNTWFHISFVFRNSDGLRKIYINGIDESGSGPNLTSTPSGIGSTLEIGKYVKGKLADFRIYSTALSEDDIKEIYQTKASIDKNGNLYCGNINNGDMIWDSEINSINLVTNGSAELENNTNFTSFNYITTDSYDGAGCLSRTGAGTLYSNEYIKIDKYNGSYYLSGYFKSAGSSGLNSRLYFGIACFDYLKRLINADMVCHYTNTETTLAQPLNNGDTIVYLTSASNWHTSASSKFSRKLGVYYNEIDIYPKYTYTRSTVYYTEADLINNTITLTTPWSGGTIPTGSFVSNNYDANTYQYISASYTSVPFTWTKYINSTAVSGWNINNPYSYFRYGTEYIKLLFLSNYGQDSTYTTLMDNLKFWNTKAENKAVNINIEKTSNVVATEFSEVGITEGLVAYYPLNGDAKDYSGNDNHGTIYGAIKASGIAGKKCYYFDGTDDYIDCGITPLITANSFSISLWFNKLSIPATYSRLITLATYLDGFGLGISDSATYLGVYFGSTSNFVRLKTSSIPNNNEWYHLVLTCNGDVTSANSYNTYLNMTILSTTSTSVFSACDNKSIIGARHVSTTPGYYFNGKIQDVRIYNRALTTTEIGILYNMYNPNINKTLQINKENIIYTKRNIKEV